MSGLDVKVLGEQLKLALQLEREKKKAEKKTKFVNKITAANPGSNASVAHPGKNALAHAQTRYLDPKSNLNTKDCALPVFVGIARHALPTDLPRDPSVFEAIAKKWCYLHPSDCIPILACLFEKKFDLDLKFFDDLHENKHLFATDPARLAERPPDGDASAPSPNVSRDRSISASTDSPPSSSLPKTIEALQVQPDDATTPATIQHNPDEHTKKRKATKKPDVPGPKRPRGGPPKQRVTATSAPSAGTPLTRASPHPCCVTRGAQASQQPPIQSAAASPNTNAASNHPGAGTEPPSLPTTAQNSIPSQDSQIPPEAPPALPLAAALENTENIAASTATGSFQLDFSHSPPGSSKQ